MHRSVEQSVSGRNTSHSFLTMQKCIRFGRLAAALVIILQLLLVSVCPSVVSSSVPCVRRVSARYARAAVVSLVLGQPPSSRPHIAAAGDRMQSAASAGVHGGPERGHPDDVLSDGQFSVPHTISAFALPFIVEECIWYVTVRNSFHANRFCCSLVDRRS